MGCYNAESSELVSLTQISTNQRPAQILFLRNVQTHSLSESSSYKFCYSRITTLTMIPSRSKTPYRSTASRRALVIFVLGAVVPSSVLAAPTIRPRALALSFSETVPPSTQTSSGLGPLSRGGYDLDVSTNVLPRPGGVGHNDVQVLRQDDDGLQMFDHPEYVMDSHGSDLDLLLSADLEQRAELPKRGCCSLSADGESDEFNGVGMRTKQARPAQGTPAQSHLASRGPQPAGTEQREMKLIARNNLETLKKLACDELFSYAKKYGDISLHVLPLIESNLEGEKLITASRTIEDQYLSDIEVMKNFANSAHNKYGIDVQAHGGVSLKEYNDLFDGVEKMTFEALKTAKAFAERLQVSQGLTFLYQSKAS
ncbi:hypothetical protein C8R42DRAFT_743420 [Lentinula raphanica]|nr:hypothetical protein C8R42DRAFT_743420 [Lentinula raphanica]